MGQRVVECFGCHGCVVVDAGLCTEFPLGSLPIFNLKERSSCGRRKNSRRYIVFFRGPYC